MKPVKATDAPIAGLEVSAYEVPTDEPESDGTFEWDSTTMVLVRARAGGRTGLGYTYADVSTASFVESKLRPVVDGCGPHANRRRLGRHERRHP